MEKEMDNVYYEQKDEMQELPEILSIGEVAKILGCNRSLLRYYEEQFEIEVPRNTSNRRVYTPGELEKFRYILRLKENGMTNPQIKSVIESERVKRSEYTPSIRPPAEEKPPAPEPDDIRELYSIIASLRDEINELKNMGAVMEKSELVKENNNLKQKLKEKTYELVSLRENAAHKKRGFFR